MTAPEPVAVLERRLERFRWCMADSERRAAERMLDALHWQATADRYRQQVADLERLLSEAREREGKP